MRGGRSRSGPRARRRRAREPAEERGRVLPLKPVDLLAGLAPGVELHADDLPPGIDGDTPSEAARPASTTVAQAGKLLRSGDTTIKRLIRTAVLEPREARSDPGTCERDVDRAGVLPRTRAKPGE